MLECSMRNIRSTFWSVVDKVSTMDGVRLASQGGSAGDKDTTHMALEDGQLCLLPELKLRQGKRR